MDKKKLSHGWIEQGPADCSCECESFVSCTYVVVALRWTCTAKEAIFSGNKSQGCSCQKFIWPNDVLVLVQRKLFPSFSLSLFFPPENTLHPTRNNPREYVQPT